MAARTPLHTLGIVVLTCLNILVGINLKHSRSMRSFLYFHKFLLFYYRYWFLFWTLDSLIPCFSSLPLCELILLKSSLSFYTFVMHHGRSRIWSAIWLVTFIINGRHLRRFSSLFLFLTSSPSNSDVKLSWLFSSSFKPAAQEYIRRQLEEEQRQLEILQQQLLQEQALLLVTLVLQCQTTALPPSPCCAVLCGPPRPPPPNHHCMHPTTCLGSDSEELHSLSPLSLVITENSVETWSDSHSPVVLYSDLQVIIFNEAEDKQTFMGLFSSHRDFTH